MGSVTLGRADLDSEATVTGVQSAMTWLARLYIWATYRLYHEFAWAYDLAAWIVSLGRWSGWRLRALDHVAGDRVLEVGFGTGALLVDMAQRGLQVVGLDYSPEMQRTAGRKLARRGLSVPRVRALTQAMPFAAGSFDSILSTFPAAYILDPATLAEVARLLRRPNPERGIAAGRLVVVGMVVAVQSRSVRRAQGLLFGAPGEHVVDRFERIAGEAGLRVRVVEQEGERVRVPVFIAEKE
jgi:SAM-dependent methyltransferase